MHTRVRAYTPHAETTTFRREHVAEHHLLIGTVMSDNTNPTNPTPEFTPEELQEARYTLISRETGLRTEFIATLKGDTVEELTANAAYMAKRFPGACVGNAPSDRVGPLDLDKQRAATSAIDPEDAPEVRDEDGKPDPEKLAAAIRDRMN